MTVDVGPRPGDEGKGDKRAECKALLDAIDRSEQRMAKPPNIDDYETNADFFDAMGVLFDELAGVVGEAKLSIPWLVKSSSEYQSRQKEIARSFRSLAAANRADDQELAKAAEGVSDAAAKEADEIATSIRDYCKGSAKP